MFTNNSGTACTLSGYPGVSLLVSGRALRIAGRSAAHWTTVTLAPHGRAQASIVADSQCQAALSDTVRVYPPNFTVYFETPLELRGCSLAVGPVQAA